MTSLLIPENWDSVGLHQWLSNIYLDRLHLGVVIKSTLAQLPTNAELLEPTERCLGREKVIVINPNSPFIFRILDAKLLKETLLTLPLGLTIHGQMYSRL